jgi:beta-lactamase superfamily II metal-dependent hydrolase
MFRIDMLPADHGDCLWIEYGAKESPHRILIDGGTAHSYPDLRRRIESLPPGQRRFELFVVTHVDVDHIGGSLELLRDMENLKIKFRDVWFNGWEQIAPSVMGPLDGERLSDRLKEGVKQGRLKWNQAFQGKAAVVPSDEDTNLPTRKLSGGMKLTLLAPTESQLKKLRAEWVKVVTAAGLVPGKVKDEKRRDGRRDILGAGRIDVEGLADSKFSSDTAVANGSSIAMLAEYNGQSCLFTGDAYATTLAASLRRLKAERGIGDRPLPLDALKLPHHGSRNNLSAELIGLVKCRRYLFSTNGNIFKHPNMESVARVIRYGGAKPQLFFNYRSPFNEMWDDSGLMNDYEYRVKYCGKKDEGFLRVEL